MTLPCLKIALTFEALEPVVPPHAIGAMWRSVLGAALRRRDAALYRLMFEAKPPAGLGSGFDDAPAPFVLDAPFPPEVVVAPGDPLGLTVTLFGPAAAHVETVLTCFAEAAERGLGKGRGRAVLAEAAAVWRDDAHDGAAPHLAPVRPVPVPEMPDRVRVAFTSPLRLKKNGVLIEPRGFAAEDWLIALSRRHHLNSVLYGAAPAGLPRVPEPIPIHEVQLWTLALHRWSAQQKREIDMSVIMGSFVLPMAEIEALWPALWQAQWFHAGAMTTAGLGGCRIHPA